MEYRILGTSGLKVSVLSLGTMTFGEQNTQAEAEAQLDLALEQGVNLIDTAEMYPVPPRAETQGASERFIGAWLKRRGRDQVVLATKVAGPARGLRWLRGGPRLSAAHIRQALEDSLRRLNTDYVDLYQLHWPDRYVPMFGESLYEESRDRETVSIHEQLEALAALVHEGKIRQLGLSNETPWGVCRFVRLAEEHGLPRVASVQNAYHLLNRSVETGGLAEVAHREQVPVLVYSPLAFGWLSGKYHDAPDAPGRVNLFRDFARRYHKPCVHPATEEYVRLARDAGLEPARMAIAFAASRPFVASVIVGATSIGQLSSNLAAARLKLPADLLHAIDDVHLRYPNPAP